MKLKKLTKKKKTKTKKRKPYFGKEAHAAIVKFQECNVRCEKNKIYEKLIKPSFEKLTENLIFIHGFSRDKESFHCIKSDCVSFLYEILEKFDHTKGSKAFSYFNVCAKNYLIIQSKKNKKNLMRHVSLYDENLNTLDKLKIENYQVIPSQEETFILNEDKETLMLVLKKIKEKTFNTNEKKCIDAIITLFENIQELDFLNKRAVFVYLRELSGLNAKQLSVAMSSLRRIYRDTIKSSDEYILFSKG